MKKILLGIIAINLTFISGYLFLRSIEPVQADLSGMNEYDLSGNNAFREAVRRVVTDECIVKIKRDKKGTLTTLTCYYTPNYYN